jgi:hypothetical protein
MVELPQPVHDLQCIGIDVATRERVFGARDHPRLDHWTAL